MGWIYYNIIESFDNIKSIPEEDGCAFIEYRYENVKLGYLIVSLIEGIAVIRTFLFLTNSNTPEGRNLHENTGLEAIEKRYLSLDKL